MKKVYPLFFFQLLLLFLSQPALAAGSGQNFSKIFIENKGQVKDEKGGDAGNVLFYNQGQQMQVFVTSTGFSLITTASDPSKTTYNKVDIKLEHATIQRDQVIFVKGNNPAINFYHGSNTNENVRTAGTVIIRNIYPGIDWLWEFTKNNTVKHEFMVNLGADAGLIKYTINGAQAKLNPEGNSILYSTDQMVVKEGPVLVQQGNNKLSTGLQLNGNQLSFQIPANLHGGGFTIDPPLELLWGATLDSLRTSFKSVVFDTFAHTVAPNYASITVGYSSDYAVPTFPQVNGSYAVFPARATDLLIMKTNAAQNLIWATFFGGSNNDQANAVTATPQGMFVTGYSESWDFPQAVVSGAYNAHVSLFGRDAFIAYFDTLGKWKWSTGYGGDSTDEGMDIRYYNHRVYVAGYTQSPDFPLMTETGAFNAPQTDSLHTDGFLLAFDEHGNRLWSTCFGGTGNDYFTSLYIDSSGLYATGYSQPAGPQPIPLQPAGPAYFQHSFQNEESFITRFNGSDALTWSTYFGGPGNDIANCVVKNNTGLFICGKTNADGLPVLSQNNSNYYQPAYAGGANDGFIARFDGDSFQQRYTTYYGTDSDDVFTKMGSGFGGDLILTGYTNGKITHVGDPHLLFTQDTIAGGYDGLMVGLNSVQDTFWATYFGSDGNDFGYSLALLDRYLIDMVGEGFYNYGKYRIGGTYLDEAVCSNENICPQVSTNGETNRFLNPLYIGFIIGGGAGGGGGGGGGGSCDNFLQFHALIPQQNSCPNQCDGHAYMDTANINGCPPFTFLWNNGDNGLTDTALCEFYWSRVIDVNNQERTIYGRFNVLRVLFTEPVATYCPYSTNNIDWDSVIHLAGGGPPYNIDFAGTNAGTCPTQTYFYITDTAACVLHYTAPWYQYNQGVTANLTFTSNCKVEASIQIQPGTCSDIPPNAQWVISDGTDTVHIHCTGDVQPDLIEAALPGHTYSGYLQMGSCEFPLFPIHRDTVIRDSMIFTPACGSAGGSISVIVQSDTGALHFDGSYRVELEITGIDTAYYNYSTLFFNSANPQTSVFNNLSPSRYRIHLFHNINNCDSISTVVDLRTMQFHFQTPQLFCARTDTLKATTDGGQPPYSFQWSASPVNDSAIVIDSGGTYALTVTDAAGCIISHSILVVSTLQLVIDTVQENLVPCQPNTLLSTAVVTFHGGVPAYSVLWSSNEITNLADSLPVGDNWVIVTDVVGCADTFDFHNTKQYPPSIADSAMNVTCNGYHDGGGTIYVTGGYSPFQYQWNNGLAGPSIINQGPGFYSFTVTDVKGCTGNSGFQIIEPAPIQYLVQTTADTCGSGNGTATVQVIGGTGPYSVLWDDNSTGFTDSTLTAGDHTFIITDSLGCNSPNAVTIDNFSFIDAAVATTDVTCNGAHDGTATLQVISATYPVTVTWSIGFSNPLTNLAPGTYSVTLTDANSCKNILPFQISEPDPLQAFVDTGGGILCNGQSAFVSLSAIGGTQPYNGTYDQSQLAGNYPNLITDANGCSVELDFSLSQPAPITAGYYVLKAPSCTNDGEIEIYATGGVAPFYYDDGFNSFGQFYDSAHVYNVNGGQSSYNVSDNNGCLQTLDTDIPFLSNFQVADSVIQPTCLNPNGRVTIYAVAGTAPYTLITGNGTTQFNDSLMITLSGGSYTYVIRDSASCEQFISISINDTAFIQAAVTTTDVTCHGSANGSAALSITTAAFPVSITWSAGSSNDTIFGLTPGDYDVSVTDANGCFIVPVFTIDEPDTLIASVDTGSGIICNGGTSLISVFATGGTPPYQGTYNANQVEGNYSQLVTDNNGCTSSVSFSITGPPVLSISYAVLKSPTCSNDGQVEVYASGGVAPYTVQVNGNPAIQFTDSLQLTGLAAGSLSINIADSNLCSQLVNTTLTATSNFSFTYSATQPNCNNFYGTATFYATGGQLPYTVTDGFATYTFLDSITVSDAPGAYNFIVTDSIGCTLNFDTLFNQWTNFNYTQQMSPVLCKGDNNGSVTIHMNGGIPPYLHSGVPFDSILVINNLSAGMYTDSITDSMGCMVFLYYEVTEPRQLVVDSVILVHDLTCYNISDGIIVVYASGGTPSYIYKLTSQNGLNLTQQNNVFTNLGPDVYTVTVTDSNGCSANNHITINPFVLTHDSIATDSVTCNDGHNGAIRIYPTPGDRSPFTYSLDGGIWQPYNVYYSLVAGTYQVIVADKNNCRDTLNISIWQPDPIDARVWLNGELLPIDSIILNERLYADFTKERNQYPWEIVFSPDVERIVNSDTEIKVQPREDITFLVTVFKDSFDKNCFVQYRGYVELRNVPWMPNTITPNGDGFNDTWKIDLDKFPHSDVLIFDRWGEIIYESKDYANDWDCMYHGKKIADGTYFYILKVPSQGDAVYKGDINVLNSSH